MKPIVSVFIKLPVISWLSLQQQTATSQVRIMDKKINIEPLESQLEDIIKKKSEENEALKKLLKNLEDSSESKNGKNK